jgi:hypothetical protein
MKGKKPLFIGAVIALGTAFAYYLASPLLAANSLKNAVISKNADEANKYIDYSALRENLKAELTAHAMKQMQQDPEMASNPFNGFAFAMVGPMVNAMVDNYITPSGMKTIMKFASDPSSATDDTSRNIAEKVASTDKMLKETSMGYDGLDKFQVLYKNQDGTKGKLVFNRKGFAGWNLTNINSVDDAN